MDRNGSRSIKSVDSSALSISEEAHLKSPSISPDSDVQTVKDMQTEPKNLTFFILTLKRKSAWAECAIKMLLICK